MVKTKHKKTDHQKQEARLDDLHREYIRKRAMKRVGGCERCHTPKRDYTELQTAHFHTRGSHTVRWDLRNSVGLCGGCHMFIDKDKEAKIELEKQILGDAEYERLYVLANMTTKQSPVDMKLVEIVLRELVKEV